MSPEISVAAITASCAFIGAIVVALIQRNATIADDIRATKEQVQNSHETNLRDDLDAMHETIRVVLRSVEGLHEEIRTERTERIAVSNRLLSATDRLDEHITDHP